jgi:hypothetical protein
MNGQRQQRTNYSTIARNLSDRACARQDTAHLFFRATRPFFIFIFLYNIQYSTVIYLLVFSPLKRRLPCAALFSAGEHKVEYSSIQYHSSKYRYRQRKPSFLPCLPRAPWKRRTMGPSQWNLLCSEEGRRPQVVLSLTLQFSPSGGVPNSKLYLLNDCAQQAGSIAAQRDGCRKQQSRSNIVL